MPLYRRPTTDNRLTPIPFGERADELFTDGAVDRAKLRAHVSGCTMCHKDRNIVPAPRYGTGYAGAKLCIVGQNPPLDAGRAMHGAWLAHYPDVPKGPHEKLVAEVLDMLGVQPQELFATQAMKCVTAGNETPYSWSQATPCARRFLQYELAWAKPKVILTFGAVPRAVVRDLLCLGQTELLRAAMLDSDVQTWRMTSTYDRMPPAWVERYGTLVCAPHPSIVHRFITKARWMEAIKEAYVAASQSTIQFKLIHEVQPGV